MITYDDYIKLKPGDVIYQAKRHTEYQEPERRVIDGEIWTKRTLIQSRFTPEDLKIEAIIVPEIFGNIEIVTDMFEHRGDGEVKFYFNDIDPYSVDGSDLESTWGDQEYFLTKEECEEYCNAR